MESTLQPINKNPEATQQPAPQPVGQSQTSLTDEPRITNGEQYFAIYNNAYALQHLAYLRENPPSSRLEGKFIFDEKGIPRSALVTHLEKQARAANNPLERIYIEQAIANEFPSSEQVKQALEELGVNRISERVMRQRRVNMMKVYEEEVLKSLKTAFPTSEFCVDLSRSEYKSCNYIDTDYHATLFDLQNHTNYISQTFCLVNKITKPRKKGHWIWRKQTDIEVKTKKPFINILYETLWSIYGNDVSIAFSDARAVVPCKKAIQTLNSQANEKFGLKCTFHGVNDIS